MGNRQSLTITQPETDHIEKKDKNDQPNGHAVSGLNLTDAVTCEASVKQNTEPAPVTVTFNVKQAQASIETNGTQAKSPTVSVQAVSATTMSVEKEIPAETSTPAKDTPKQAGTPSMFNKMFKKKTGPADEAAEVPIVPAVETDIQKSSPTAASIEMNGTQVKASTISVDAAGIQISTTTVSPEKETPAEPSTPAKDTPSKFNMMFKKKSRPADMAADVKSVPVVEMERQISTPTQLSVETNATQAIAPNVSVDGAGIQISTSAASVENAESSTPAKDTPKQAGTPSKFNMMFKKKSRPADMAADVTIVPTVEVESQKSTPTQLSVETKGIQAIGPTVSVDAAGIQISTATASVEKEVRAESSTTDKDTPKQAGTPSKFNMMFKKKSRPADMAADVTIVPTMEVESQKSTPTQLSVETKGIQAIAPTVSVDGAGIQISTSAASVENAESSTTDKDTPKQAGTPSKFNMMFKKKSRPADMAADVTIVPTMEVESQKSTPTQLSVETKGIQAIAPTVSVDGAGIQICTATASVEKEAPAESSTTDKDTPKQAGTPSKFNMMFKKKSRAADMAADVTIDPTVEVESQKSTPTQLSVETKGIQAIAPTVSVDGAGIQISTSAASVEKDVRAESSTTDKDTPKQAGTPSKFNMMFKKKSRQADMAADVTIVPTMEVESQKSTPTQLSVETKGIQAIAPTVSVDGAGIQISTSAASVEKDVRAESSTTDKDTPKQAGTPSKFNMMFKKKSRPADMAADVTIDPTVEVESQKSTPIVASIETPTVSVDAAGIQISGTSLSAEKENPAESSTLNKDTPKQAGTPSMFNKMFKKKTYVAAEVMIVPAVETDSQKSEPTDIKASPQADKDPQGEALELSTTEVTQDSTHPEETGAEENSVMNFFKTFVTSTKTTKEATPSPDVSKEKSQKETPPAPAANVQEASKVPPPPPPAPPKMESKAEPAVKKEEAPAGEVAAVAKAAKDPEAQSKAKTKDSPFSKLFRSKNNGKVVSKVRTAGVASVSAKTSSASGVKEEAKPVEIQVDASKASTLEASAKPEPPPAPKPEEKKAEKKPSPFANLLKPKVLLGQVSAKIHAAASSASASISLGAGGAATESKKETPAAPTAPADAAPSTKAKEEPKPAAPAAPAATSADNKSVGSTDNSSPSTSRKLEKRNSIHLFFKNLGQKRHSDAGVQTEPVAPEKAK